MQRPVTTALALGLLLVGPPALAGIFGFGKDKDVDTDTAPVAAPEVPVAPPPPPSVPLWDQPALPVSPGGLPEGLANLSAQGCAACHGELVEAWSGSAHARLPSDALLDAARTDSRCLSCHLPLTVQHPTRSVRDGGDPRTPVTGPNPDYEATLAMEGVTCATCHVRDGAVLGATAGGSPHSPHGGGWSEQLTDARTCAPCHQLTWAGTDRPLYDTVGEWERSAYAEAGIGCADCHLDGGAGHGMDLPPERAVSLLLELPPEPVVRGGDVVSGEVILQNTGAGHAFPTGSPWQGVQLEVGIEGPDARGEGRAPWGETLVVQLRRELSEGPQYTTTSDTRLRAGEQKRWPVSLTLPVDAPRGRYELVSRLSHTLVGAEGEPVVDGLPFVERRLVLRVE